MFCLYCGVNLPEDALFCNKCGKRQYVAANESTSDNAIFSFSTSPETTKISQSVSETENGEKQARLTEAKSLVPVESVLTTPVMSSPVELSRTLLVHPLGASPIVKNVNHAGKLLSLVMIIMACLAIVIIASVMLVLLPKLGQSKIPSQNIATIATLTPTPDNSLCSGDTSGSPLSSGRIDKSHPFHQDDGQATQIDQGGFTPITLCRQIKASNYVISFHVLSPYILLYLYDSNHKKYEIDYNIYADHISVVAYPGFSMANSVSVGQGTYSNSSANWHTDQINFTSNMVKVLVDGTEVISGSTGFTDDGSGDDLLIQSHQITMDQFSVTQL